MKSGAWQATIHRVVKSQTLLESDLVHKHTHMLTDKKKNLQKMSYISLKGMFQLTDHFQMHYFITAPQNACELGKSKVEEWLIYTASQK